MTALPLDPPRALASPGEVLHVGPNRITILREARETGGRFGMIQYDVAPRFVAPSVLHWHTKEDWTGYVVSGAIVVGFAGGRTVDVVAGGALTVPARCPFVWSNPSAEPARVLFLYSPGGFENYFREARAVLASHPAVAPKDLTPHLIPLWSKYGLENEG